MEGNNQVSEYQITNGTTDVIKNYQVTVVAGTLTIKKAPSSVTKAPEAKTGLVYSGSAQELIALGTAGGGTMQYALGTATEANEAYTISIPAKTEAGSYFVWYKAVGDANHYDTMPACVTVVIAPLMHTVTFDSDGGGTVEAQTVAHGGKAVKPADPAKATYTFAGWFLGDSATAFDFANTPIMSNITLKAKWNVSTAEIDAVIALINNLPNPAGVDDKAAVEAARAAYNALTDAQKALISPETLQKLVDAENQVKAAEEEASKPVKVTTIADKAFAKKGKLKTITIGANIETIGKSAFESCKSLTTIKGGKGVVTIKDKAFAGCAKLKKIPAFEKLQTIGASVFKDCKMLASLMLSANVSKIGKDAFNGCAELKKITIKTMKLTDKAVGKNAFKGINSKASFKCPKGKAKVYQKILQKKGAPKTAKFK